MHGPQKKLRSLCSIFLQKLSWKRLPDKKIRQPAFIDYLAMRWKILFFRKNINDDGTVVKTFLRVFVFKRRQVLILAKPIHFKTDTADACF